MKRVALIILTCLLCTPIAKPTYASVLGDTANEMLAFGANYGADYAQAVIETKDTKAGMEKLLKDKVLWDLLGKGEEFLLNGDPNAWPDAAKAVQDTIKVYEEAYKLGTAIQEGNFNDGAFASLELLLVGIEKAGVNMNPLIGIVWESIKVTYESHKAVQETGAALAIEELYTMVDRDRRLIGEQGFDSPALIGINSATVDYFFEKYLIVNASTRAKVQDYVENVLGEEFPKGGWTLTGLLTGTSDEEKRAAEILPLEERKNTARQWIKRLLEDVNTQAKVAWGQVRMRQQAAALKDMCFQYGRSLTTFQAMMGRSKRLFKVRQMQSQFGSIAANLNSSLSAPLNLQIDYDSIYSTACGLMSDAALVQDWTAQSTFDDIAKKAYRLWAQQSEMKAEALEKHNQKELYDLQRDYERIQMVYNKEDDAEYREEYAQMVKYSREELEEHKKYMEAKEAADKAAEERHAEVQAILAGGINPTTTEKLKAIGEYYGSTYAQVYDALLEEVSDYYALMTRLFKSAHARDYADLIAHAKKIGSENSYLGMGKLSGTTFTGVGTPIQKALNHKLGQLSQISILYPGRYNTWTDTEYLSDYLADFALLQKEWEEREELGEDASNLFDLLYPDGAKKIKDLTKLLDSIDCDKEIKKLTSMQQEADKLIQSQNEDINYLGYLLREYTDWQHAHRESYFKGKQGSYFFHNGYVFWNDDYPYALSKADFREINRERVASLEHLTCYKFAQSSNSAVAAAEMAILTGEQYKFLNEDAVLRDDGMLQGKAIVTAAHLNTAIDYIKKIEKETQKISEEIEDKVTSSDLDDSKYCEKKNEEINKKFFTYIDALNKIVPGGFIRLPPMTRENVLAHHPVYFAIQSFLSPKKWGPLESTVETLNETIKQMDIQRKEQQKLYKLEWTKQCNEKIEKEKEAEHQRMLAEAEAERQRSLAEAEAERKKEEEEEETRRRKEEAQRKAEEQKVQAFYEAFERSYEHKDDASLLAMMHDDWTAGDGTTLYDVEDNFRNMFMLYDDLSYNVTDLRVSCMEGLCTASYTVEIIGKNYEMDITRKEKSSVEEELQVSGSKAKLIRTFSGSFWYVD